MLMYVDIWYMGGCRRIYAIWEMCGYRGHRLCIYIYIG